MKKIFFFVSLFLRSIFSKGPMYSIARTWFHGRNYISRLFEPNSIQRLHLFQDFSHDPLVSVVIVNYNSEKYIPAFLRTLRSQSYRNVELIVVDNGSTDNSLKIIEREWSDNNIKVIRNTNTGFASGCNIGSRAARGEILAFVNTDTLLDKYWLKGLVDGLRFDTCVAAVTSKTLFLEDFFDITIECCTDFDINISTLEGSLHYPKYFIRSDHHKVGNYIICGKYLVISVPANSTKLEFRFRFNQLSKHSLKLRIGRQQELSFVCNDFDYLYTVYLPEIFDATPVINNAGSDIRNGDNPYDRGYGEYDRGQYDRPEYIKRFCGCSFAVRQTAITRRPPFIDQFFAYYEDSELSRYLFESGYNILYTPKSLLRHHHSASSIENSPFWKYLVERSYFIYSRDFSQESLRNALDDLYRTYFEAIPPTLQPLFKQFDEQLFKGSNIGFDLVPKSRAIAIYNSFWNTFGGGEIHALNVVRDFFKEDDKVFFISENDFDLERLFIYFGIKPFQGCKSIGVLDSQLTANFDIFINSTYCSNFIPRAKHSFYIVSFPHKSVSTDFLKSYHFLFNSTYTRFWAEKYWGSVNGSLRLPVDSIYVSTEQNRHSKERLFILVGRFCTGGHRKMQLEVVQAFQAARTAALAPNWKLILLGSLDENDAAAKSYFQHVISISGLDQNIEVHANASRSLIQQSYLRASYLISATGLGESCDQPELFEHFGIAVLEGLTYGCAPIVHKTGGPALLATSSGLARLFSNQEELIACIIDAMNAALPNSNSIIEKIRVFIDKHQYSNLTNAHRLISGKTERG